MKLNFEGLDKAINPIYYDNGLFNNHPLQIYFGGSSSGKSHFLAQRCVLDCITGRNYLIVRKVGNSLKRSVYNEIYSKIIDLNVLKYFHFNGTDLTFTCKLNNKQILLSGLDDVEKLKSTKPINGVLTDIWIEEATETDYGDFKQLDKRLRGESEFNKRITLSFNPIIQSHWIYLNFFTEWKNGINYYEDDRISILKTTYKDNFFLTTDDKERLESETDERFRRVYIEGDWGLLQGAVFSNWEVGDFKKEQFEQYRFGLDWGFACLVGDTQVMTDKGNKAIKDIEVGDKVLTRYGYSKVTFKQSKGIKEVYAVDLGKKNRIIATGDHRIYTSNGWKRVDELQELEILCVKKSNLMGKFITGIQRVNTQIIFIPTIVKSVQFYIGIFGNIITALFQKGILFTTLTIIHLITIFQTLCAYILVSIPKFIIKKTLALFQKKEQKKSEKFTDIQQQTGKKEEKNHFLLHKLEEEYAKNVERNIKLLTCIKNTVVQNVGNVPILETVKKNISAKYVALCSLLRHIIQEQPVLMSVHIKRQLLTEKKEVFDITVENGEFFANGVLVHNCDPFAFIRLAIDNKHKIIYICDEIYGQGLLNDYTIPLVFKMSKGSIVWCDSSEPKSIAEFRTKGINAKPVKKGQGSIQQGVNFLRRYKIIIHKSCKNTIKEFQAYRYKEDKNGNILPDIVDKDNHAIDAIRYGIERDSMMRVSFADIV